jgi:hypothetical protein
MFEQRIRIYQYLPELGMSEPGRHTLITRYDTPPNLDNPGHFYQGGRWIWKKVESTKVKRGVEGAIFERKLHRICAKERRLIQIAPTIFQPLFADTEHFT